MHQTVLSVEKVDSHILQKLNDTKKNSTKEIPNSKLSLFDRIKTANQENRRCTEIRKALQENKKSYDEMLLKKFKSIENILLFKEKF
jgi:vacuolar-type H+-ATPase subunit H